MWFQARGMKASIPERARKKSFQSRPWSKRVPFPTPTSTPGAPTSRCTQHLSSHFTPALTPLS